MKKIALILLLCLVALGACGQTKVVVGKNITVVWDAPVLGGIPVAEIAYEVVVEPYPTGVAVLVATIATLEQLITFAVEGPYRIGVRVKRTVADGTVLFSEYLWGDIEGSPQPWYVVYYATPPRVQRVRIK